MTEQSDTTADAPADAPATEEVANAIYGGDSDGAGEQTDAQTAEPTTEEATAEDADKAEARADDTPTSEEGAAAAEAEPEQDPEPKSFTYESKAFEGEGPVADLVAMVSGKVAAGESQQDTLTSVMEWVENAMVTAASQIADAMTAWKTELENDPDLGGENFPQTIGKIEAAAQVFEDPKFTDLIRSTGMIYHPTFAKGLVKLAELTSGDTFIGSGIPRSAVPIYDQIYPSTAKGG